MLDGVYQSSEGVPVFHEVRAPTIDQLQDLLAQIITRIMKLLTRQGYLIEEEGMSYLGEIAADRALTPLQAASCTYRIALGPRAGHKVLSLQTVTGQAAQPAQALCANAHGFEPRMRQSVVAPTSASNSNACAAPSPAPPLPLKIIAAIVDPQVIISTVLGNMALWQSLRPLREVCHAREYRIAVPALL